MLPLFRHPSKLSRLVQTMSEGSKLREGIGFRGIGMAAGMVNDRY